MLGVVDKMIIIGLKEEGVERISIPTCSIVLPFVFQVLIASTCACCLLAPTNVTNAARHELANLPILTILHGLLGLAASLVPAILSLFSKQILVFFALPLSFPLEYFPHGLTIRNVPLHEYFY